MGMIDWRSCATSEPKSLILRFESYTNGSQCNFTLKMMMRTSPVKKVGTEKPKYAKVENTWSALELRLTAEKTPTGGAMKKPTMQATPTTARLCGRRWSRSARTGE